MLGSLAEISPHWVPAFVKLNGLSDKFFDEVWIHEQDTANMRVNLSFTPTYSYTRADCPQYAGLKGPSCYTAPLVPTRPELPDVLLPQNYQPPPDLAPPSGTVVGENGNLVAVGPPLVNPNPSLADPNPPLPSWMPPSAPVPGTANPALVPDPQPPQILSPVAPVAPKPGDPPPPAPAPPTGPAAPGGPVLPAEAAPATYGGNFHGGNLYGGNVGPVGSQQERNQLAVITGQPASTATQLLLGPVARGATVSLADSSSRGGNR